MKLLKPPWVNHDGKPIFSVDIHPDGSKFATGGQGELDSGTVKIWSLKPVRSEVAEKDDKVHKMLCHIDSHLACVNCVRWSGIGRCLASGGDDKIVMIWQQSRGTGPSTAFGSGGKVVNIETWRCVTTLRGHSGDVLDLAWSPNDSMLASCSVDNTIIIWNALTFPEQTKIKIITGHTGLVKGVTWDPVGKYLASQSDDKSVRVWRTLDWQQEFKVTKPFAECGGTTHVLRLNWSPDGNYIVSAHAMNNSGPTAQIIERDGWKAGMDFVGHRKAITVVRFNPKILSKKIKKSSTKPQQYCCCAIGSRDRALSVWLTALKRPLVVVNDLFSNSILDVTWSTDGMELIACSWDGSVAYLSFSREELGTPLTQEQKNKFHQAVYGVSVTAVQNAPQIIETAAMLKLQQDNQEAKRKERLETTPKKVPAAAINGNSVDTPSKQIETRTADGRRRITPIFLAPYPDIGDLDGASLFAKSNEPVFSSSNEPSKIVIEKKDHEGGTTPKTSPSKPVEMEITEAKMTALDNKLAEKKATPKHPKDSEKKKEKEKKDYTPDISRHDGDRNKDKKIKRRIELTPAVQNKRPKILPISSVTTSANDLEVAREDRRAITSSYVGLRLPELKIEKNYVLQVEDAKYTVENGIQSGIYHLNRLIKTESEEVVWEQLLGARIVAVSGSCQIICVACHDGTISIFSTTGRRLLPAFALDSPAAVFHSNGPYVMVVTSRGSLYVWNAVSQRCLIENKPLQSIISGNHLRIEDSQLTEQGVPIISLSNGKSHLFKPELGCWLQLSSSEDPIVQSSNHHSFLPPDAVFKNRGALAHLQSLNPGSQPRRMFHSSHPLQKSSSFCHLEYQMTAALAIKSASEYKFWLIGYTRYLVQENLENKLRELCDDLLGPLFASKSNNWEPKILGIEKRSLLEEVLPLIGSNLQLQRLFMEYQEQLDSVKT